MHAIHSWLDTTNTLLSSVALLLFWASLVSRGDSAIRSTPASFLSRASCAASIFAVTLFAMLAIEAIPTRRIGQALTTQLFRFAVLFVEGASLLIDLVAEQWSMSLWALPAIAATVVIRRIERTCAS